MAASLSAPFVKTAPQWRALSRRKSVEGAARAYARANMVAVLHRGDDSAVWFLYDVANDRVARKVVASEEWVA